MAVTDQLTHEIIGCAMNVHNGLGCGFQEILYHRALSLELERAGLVFSHEQEMDIFYKGALIGTRRADFLVENQVMVEIKAIEKLMPLHKTQAINYLEIYGVATGLLLNFGSTSLEFNRLFNKKM